jgi:hypothetical protein
MSDCALVDGEIHSRVTPFSRLSEVTLSRTILRVILDPMNDISEIDSFDPIMTDGPHSPERLVIHRPMLLYTLPCQQLAVGRATDAECPREHFCLLGQNLQVLFRCSQTDRGKHSSPSKPDP